METPAVVDAANPAPEGGERGFISDIIKTSFFL